MMPQTLSLCVICNQPIGPEDKDFSENQENHPGVLGEVHRKCYDKEIEARPDLPWTDPISGEVDYDEMSEDLGVSNGLDSDEETDGF
jgi:hypothetical protein